MGPFRVCATRGCGPIVDVRSRVLGGCVSGSRTRDAMEVATPGTVQLKVQNC